MFLLRQWCCNCLAHSTFLKPVSLGTSGGSFLQQMTAELRLDWNFHHPPMLQGRKHASVGFRRNPLNNLNGIIESKFMLVLPICYRWAWKVCFIPTCKWYSASLRRAGGATGESCFGTATCRYWQCVMGLWNCLTDIFSREVQPHRPSQHFLGE